MVSAHSSQRRFISRIKGHIDWRIWPALLVTLAVLTYLARLSFPAYPYYYDGNVFYPLMVVYNNLLFQASLIILSCFSLFKLFQLLKRQRTKSKTILAGISIIWSTTLCVAPPGPTIFAPSFSHITSTYFDEHVYHLALSDGSSRDLDSLITVYIVYQCDSLGFVCHNYYCPIFEADFGSLPTVNGFGIGDNMLLYIEIGGKKLEVRHQCLYDGDYYK